MVVRQLDTSYWMVTGCSYFLTFLVLTNMMLICYALFMHGCYTSGVDSSAVFSTDSEHMAMD